MSVAVTESYGVASGHPLAADAGMDVLRAGGSAVDAVLAAAFAQWVVNGPLCGPGGDLFVLHVPGDGRAPVVYGGWSRTPLGFPVDGPVKPDGPRAAVVPGGLAGAAAASAGAGRLSWAGLFAAAIRLADGHAVTEWMARSYRSVLDKGHSSALAGFLDQSTAPSTGDIVSCSRFGKTMRALADGGADEFYRGALAEQIAAASTADGGYLTTDDLASIAADVRPAIVHDLGDVTAIVTPAPSQAGIVAQLMAAVAPEMSPESVAYAEATAPIVERELTNRCIVGVPGTAASVATDGEDMAAVVHSLAGVQFGTGWVVGDTGIALGNRVGTSLTTRPDLSAAHPVPGGVLPHTLSAAVFRSAGRTALVATPGGDRQVQWLAQAGQRFRRGESLEAVASGPRWFVCPEGDRFGVPGGIGSEWFLFGEPEVEWSAHSALAGYTVRRIDSVGGGVQAVERTDTGWTLASDPRSGGAARVLIRVEEETGRV
jgi:gamma-glutamyltranspeptidase/glutathione hydrolase